MSLKIIIRGGLEDYFEVTTREMASQQASELASQEQTLDDLGVVALFDKDADYHVEVQPRTEFGVSNFVNPYGGEFTLSYQLQAVFLNKGYLTQEDMARCQADPKKMVELAISNNEERYAEVLVDIVDCYLETMKNQPRYAGDTYDNLVGILSSEARIIEGKGVFGKIEAQLIECNIRNAYAALGQEVPKNMEYLVMAFDRLSNTAADVSTKLNKIKDTVIGLVTANPMPLNEAYQVAGQ